MRITVHPVVGGALATIFALFAFLVWYALIRAVPETTSQGIIHGATLADAETVERLVPRSHRNLEHVPRQIKYEIPERYIYDIEIVDAGERVNFSNMSPKLEYQNGDRVTVRYVERSLPLVWKKRFILEVTPATN